MMVRLRPQVKRTTSAGGAIDNKIEQAMDLVKSHLLFAVREEVEVLKVQIKELAEKNEQLQRENTLLRQNHGPPQGTALAQASQPQGAPMGMQQTIPQQQPTPHPQAIPQQQYTTTGGAQGQTLPPPQQGQTLPPPQGQLQGAPSIALPQQGIPQQQAAPHTQGMPQQQPTAQLQMQQPAPHLQQPTSQSIPMQQQQPQHSIPGTQQTGLSQAQHGVAPSQSQHGVAPSQQPVQHSQQQPPPPNT